MACPNPDHSVQGTEAHQTSEQWHQADETEPGLGPNENECQEPNAEDDSNGAIDETFIEIHDHSPSVIDTPHEAGR